MAGQNGQYDNTNRGALFPNKRKTPGDSKPDYTGKLNISGTEFWLSGWVKTPNAGGPKFLNLKIGDACEQQPQQQQQPQRPAQQGQRPQPPAAPPAQDQGPAFKEDDIPF